MAKFSRSYLVVSVVLVAVVATTLVRVSAQDRKAGGAATTGQETEAARPHFAFWYEPWNGAQTFTQLGKPQTVIGIAPSQVSSAHENGARVLRYVTYYQSRFGQPLLKDADDLPNVGFWNGHDFLRSAFGGENNYVLCDDSKVVHQRALDDMRRMITEKHFDGLFVDNAFLAPAAEQQCKSAIHTHVTPNVNGGEAWLQLLSEVRKQLKEISPAALLVTNPGEPRFADKLQEGTLNVWDLSDYVLWESYGYTSYRGSRHDAWQRTLNATFELPEAKRRKILALSYPINRSEALFSFAVSRIFGLEWTANLGQNEIGTNTERGHFGSFTEGLPYKLGQPTAPLRGGRNSDRIARTFVNGEAIANISNGPITVDVPGDVLLFSEDTSKRTTTASRIILPQRAAAIYIHP